MMAYLFLVCFMGLVPATLSLLRPVAHRYYLIMTNVTWPVAQNYCRETYDDLATIESELDWLRLKTEVAREGLSGNAWVGLYKDIDNWHWSLNDVPIKNNFQHWSSGQPDSAGQSSCGQTGPHGYWWSCPCTDLFPFICYNAKNNYSSRFVGVTSKLTWNEAEAYCRKFHTDLISVNSTTDNNAMQTIAYLQGSSWIGLYRDTWKWSDGLNVSNLLWLPGQPDNYYQDENCAVVNNGTFMDTKCNELNYFICHTTQQMREQQILKIKVKSDGSVFNSDVQADIFELIKKKLGENNMLVNTTVTWRVKSDGQIFRQEKNYR